AGASGCLPPIPEPPPPENGQRWCLYADPATGWRSDDESLAEITDPATGLWMSACTCFCAEDHAVILAGVNGTLPPGSEAETFFGEQVAILRTAAEIACLERVNELQVELGTTLDFDSPGAVSCQAAVADEVPQYATACEPGEARCLGGGTGEPGTGPPTSGTEAGSADESTSSMAGTGGDSTATDEGGQTTGMGVDGLRTP
ncbi:MAG: hypothetical protein KDK70_43345, partial [Myxococcales bacterium]|nr:hypothetical protein [Myxococcales bacterium]